MALVDDIRGKIAARQYEFSKHAVEQTMIATEVTYTLEHDGKFYVIEHVPARMCRETGEQYFAPETVEHIHALVEGRKAPKKVIETPVYEYA